MLPELAQYISIYSRPPLLFQGGTDHMQLDHFLNVTPLTIKFL